MGRHIRTLTITILTVLTYLSALFFLFRQQTIVESLIIVGLLYILLQFCTIEHYKTMSRSRYVPIAGTITLLITFLVGRGNRYIIIASILFHAGLLLVIYNVWIELTNRREISSRNLFHGGGYVTTSVILLSGVFLGLGTTQGFTLTCDEISGYSNGFVDRLTAPFKLGYDQAQQIKNTITTTTSSTISQVLGLQSQTPVPQTETTNSGAMHKSPGLLGVLEGYKDRLINQVINDNTLVNSGVCEYLLGQVIERYNNPVFQFSIIVLLYILIIPFVRIVTILLDTIARLLFMLLRLCRGYRFDTEWKEVEVLG